MRIILLLIVLREFMCSPLYMIRTQLICCLYSIRAKLQSATSQQILYTSDTLAEATSDIAHFFPNNKVATSEMNDFTQEHQLMPFDVSHLGVSLSDLTWLQDHEIGKGSSNPEHGSAGLDTGASEEYQELHQQVVEPLNALRLLNDEYVESLPESVRKEVLQRRLELDLAEARSGP